MHPNSAKLVPLLVCRAAGSLADQTMLYAVPVIVYRQTGDIAASGMAFAIEWLPRLLGLAVSGVIADRTGARRVYLIADLARTALCMIAFALAIGDGNHAFMLAAVAGLAGFFQQMAFVSLESTVPKMVSGAGVQRAQSLLQAADQTAQVLGPSLAVFLSLRWSLAGLFGIAAAVYLMSAVNVLVSFPRDQTRTARGLRWGDFGRDLLGGLKLVMTNPRLRTIVALTMLVNVIMGICLATTPGFIQQHFGRAETDLGTLNSMAGAAGIATFIAIRMLGERLPLARLGALGFTLFFAASLTMGLAETYTGFRLAYLLLFVALGLVNVFIRTERVRWIPPDRFGAVIGVIVLLNLSVLPVAGWIVAASAPRIEVPHLLLLVSAAAVVLGAWLAATLRKQSLIEVLIQPAVEMALGETARR